MDGEEALAGLPPCRHCGESGSLHIVTGWDCWLVECSPPLGCGARGPWADGGDAAVSQWLRPRKGRRELNDNN
jgi:hypothetical protein